MKIFITGGGTGGHFYPLIAVVDALQEEAEKQKIAVMNITYLADAPYNEDVLLRYRVNFKHISAGKMRRYFSLKNVTDMFKTIMGLVKAVWAIYLDYPDVVFSKGGYASFPTVFACWVLRIPLVIHESDTVPGKVNKWAGKFAEKIAISYPQTAE